MVKGVPRDLNLDNEAVKKYREVIHLQANYIQRAVIAETVSDSDRGLRIWEGVLIEWMLHGWSPKNVSGMLKNYNAVIDGLIGDGRGRSNGNRSI